MKDTCTAEVSSSSPLASRSTAPPARKGRKKAGTKPALLITAAAWPPRPYKLPESVLVVIHTPALEVLLIRRTGGEGHWQSVTGSKDALDEPFAETARREVAEETGIDTQAPGCLLTD
eukprot:gene18611-biopygen18405